MKTEPKDTTAKLHPSRFGAKAEGKLAEDRAARYLERHGLTLLARNFCIRGGEIDLICKDGSATVFVEVRLRKNPNFGGAGASITRTKQRRLILAARHWLAIHGDGDCRFDCILLDDVAAAAPMEWIRNAFWAD